MMKYKGYYGVVTYDEDAQILHGEVIGLRAVITFQADNARDIEKEFHTSVNVYLEWCKGREVKPDKEFSQVTFVLSSLKKHMPILQKEAALHGIILNQLVLDKIMNKR